MLPRQVPRPIARYDPIERHALTVRKVEQANAYGRAYYHRNRVLLLAARAARGAER